MNVNDVKVAADDLVDSRTARPHQGVFVIGDDGIEPIGGFDLVELGILREIFAVDSDGDPLVTKRVVAKKDAEIDRLEVILHDAYGEIRRGKNGKALSIIEEWGSDNE